MISLQGMAEFSNLNEKLSRSFSVPNSFLCFIWIKAHSDMLLDNLLEPQYGWGKVGRTKVGRTIDTRKRLEEQNKITEEWHGCHSKTL